MRIPLPPSSRTEWTRFRRAAAPGVRTAALPGGARRRTAIVVDDGDEVRAYVNRCPHWNVPLDQGASGLETVDGQRLRCAVHGAEFDRSDGRCLAGPCEGASLTSIPVDLDGDFVILYRDPLGAEAG